MGFLIVEILGVLLLAAAWMVAIARMIETREWSPIRPAVMVIVIAGCLALMADTVVGFMETGELRSTFYLAAWNLGMALFDMKIALYLARRGKLERRPLLPVLGQRPEAISAEARAAYEAQPAATPLTAPTSALGQDGDKPLATVA
ncbi:MAG: hypothetical protein AAFQ88_05220 [Pseudomonadota bacterium]